MSSRNGHTSQFQIINTVLRDLPETVRDRITEQVSTYNLQPDDDFFPIFLAMARLQVSLEDMPEDLREDLSGELNAWGSQAAEVIRLQTATTDELTEIVEHSRHLSKASASLLGVASDLSQRLQTSVSQFESLITQSRDTSTNTVSPPNVIESLRPTFTNLSEVLNSLTAKVDVLITQQNGNAATSVRQPNLFPVFTGLLLATVMGGFAAYTSIENRAILEGNAQVLEWLLIKENRRDCREGYLNSDSAVCRSLGR